MGEALRGRREGPVRLAEGQVRPVLAGVPSVLSRMLGDPDPARANRVMQAMLGMVKIDIKQLEEAYGR